MREMQSTWLVATVSFATLVLATTAPNGARAQSPAVHVCSMQTEKLADERIAACTRMIEQSHLKGRPAGVAYALRGLAYLDRGDIANAIADLNLAVTLAPDFAPAYQNRGNAWYARGKYGQAIADYDTAIKLDPEKSAPYLNRATVRRDLGNLAGALEDYEKAVSLGANSAKLYAGRGQVYLRQHDTARAIADFDHAVRLGPSAENFMQLAQAHEAAGNLDQALHDYRDAIMIDPKRVDAYTGQAGIWRKKNDIDKAIAAYDRAIAVDQNNAASYKLRAEAYVAKGDRKRAMTDIDRALKLNWSVNLLKARATMHIDDGNVEGATRDIDAMLKLAPGNADALALRDTINARKTEHAAAQRDTPAQARIEAVPPPGAPPAPLPAPVPAVASKPTPAPAPTPAPVPAPKPKQDISVAATKSESPKAKSEERVEPKSMEVPAAKLDEPLASPPPVRESVTAVSPKQEMTAPKEKVHKSAERQVGRQASETRSRPARHQTIARRHAQRRTYIAPPRAQYYRAGAYNVVRSGSGYELQRRYSVSDIWE